MTFPDRILDLHTHLFNARYVPLSSIIKDAMGVDESILADKVAGLLEALTGSSYHEPKSKLTDDDTRLEILWNITRHELLVATNLKSTSDIEVRLLDNKALSDPSLGFLRSSELIHIIEDLSNINYADEGWKGELPKAYEPVLPYRQLDKNIQVSGFFNWAMGVVKKALYVVTKMMDPDAWHKGENYLEFFLTMLKSEEKMVSKLFASYGKKLPTLQVVHYMMDMQLAYKSQKSPYYSFHPVQVDRMHTLQRNHSAKIFGFSAFDPRRNHWKAYAEDALKKGFLGFKFYPAMGYRPASNDESRYLTRGEIQNIKDFFSFCVCKDVPIFAHCTPEGFQTRDKSGTNAHPKYWQEVLEIFPNLRLCLGHAGGGHIKNGNVESFGWFADSECEWDHDDNFARIVAELCVAYPNVYCEIGYLTELFEKTKYLKLFINNIERAKKIKSSSLNSYDFMDKLAYGSDWHMPEMISKTRKYFNIYLNMLNRMEYKCYLNKFFWENAYRYLKIQT